MEEIKAHFLEAQQALNDFVSSEDNFRKIQAAGDLMVMAIAGGHKIISCGNGGSLCDAMHFAEELTGKYRDERPSLPAIAISDPGYMSCTSNDYGYKHVFSRFVQGMGQAGDVLLAISTSGNSENVLEAIRVAKDKNMKVVGLTGKDGGRIAGLCDVEVRAPMGRYADHAQEIHIKIIHALISYIERNIFS